MTPGTVRGTLRGAKSDHCLLRHCVCERMHSDWVVGSPGLTRVLGLEMGITQRWPRRNNVGLR